jgi:hypothetical protein
VNRGVAGLVLLTFLAAASANPQIPPASEDTPSVEARVKSLYGGKHFTEAVQLAASNRTPSATLLFYRGLSLARLGELGAAEEVFQIGSRSYPKDKRFPLELAGVAYRQKDTASARRFLHRALSLDSRDDYANDFLGTLYSLDGNLPAALFYWNRAGKPVLQSVTFEPPPPITPVLRERTFALSGGQKLTPELLLVAESNVNRLDVLADVQYELVPRKQDDRYDLLIRTVPMVQPFAGWLGQALPSLRQLPYQGLAYDAYNVRGSAMNLNALGRWDPNKRRAFVQLRGPWRENPRTEYKFFADLRDETWNLSGKCFSFPGGLNNLLLRRAEAGGDFTFGLSSKLQWTLGGLVAYRDYGRAPGQPLFARGWSAELNNRFDYLLWSWPDHRIHVDSFASLRTGRFFSRVPSRLITSRVGARAVWFPQAKGDRYVVTGQMGAGRTFGTVPLDELFILGMERDNDRDLWLRGTVGTRDGRKGSAPMGTQYAIIQTDFSRKLFEVLFLRGYLGPFFDVGAVGDPSHRYGSRGVLYDTGLQATVKTVGSVKLTLVYGRDLVSGRGVFYTAVSR